MHYKFFGKILAEEQGGVPRISYLRSPSPRAMVEVVLVAQLHFVALSHLPYYRRPKLPNGQ
jgi:hypothetical protein